MLKHITIVVLLSLGLGPSLASADYVYKVYVPGMSATETTSEPSSSGPVCNWISVTSAASGSLTASGGANAIAFNYGYDQVPSVLSNTGAVAVYTPDQYTVVQQGLNAVGNTLITATGVADWTFGGNEFTLKGFRYDGNNLTLVSTVTGSADYMGYLLYADGYFYITGRYATSENWPAFRVRDLGNGILGTLETLPTTNYDYGMKGISTGGHVVKLDVSAYPAISITNGIWSVPYTAYNIANPVVMGSSVIVQDTTVSPNVLNELNGTTGSKIRDINLPNATSSLVAGAGGTLWATDESGAKYYCKP